MDLLCQLGSSGGTNLLKEKEINLKKIVGGVFDTTSVNTGELSGIVRWLEDSIGHSILELACRHHIYELVCGAASEIILGKTNQEKEQKSLHLLMNPSSNNYANHGVILKKVNQKLLT